MPIAPCEILVRMSTTSRLRKNVIFEPIFLMAGRRQVRMMAAGARRVRAVRPVLLSSSFLQTDSSRRCQKLWDADNVVGGGSENEEPRDEGPPAMTGLAHHADSLHPAEGLLDALAFDHADGIAGMTRGAAIDRRTAVGRVLRDGPRASALAAAGDEVGGVVVLVGANRASAAGLGLDHGESRRALGGAAGLAQPRRDDEPVAVLREDIPHVAELGLLALAFAKQAGGGGCRSGLGLVRPLSPCKYCLALCSLPPPPGPWSLFQGA